MTPVTASDSATAPRAESFTGDVLAWGAGRLRDLPWRQTRDPWAILVSEVMLQQTQVERVLPRWERFLRRFPSAEACARSSLGDVLREWQGLGYPRRARNLHAAAAQVSELGGFPREIDGLLVLPGVGPYTARAVMVFAFELDVAVVDTNIARIYARILGHRLGPKAVQDLADTAVPLGDAWLWNQCLMDLGAVVCRPRNPGCDVCPVAGKCVWGGGPGDDPAIGSAMVSTAQAPFDGSDRQARGRLMRAMSEAPVERSSVASVMGRTQVVARRLLGALESEGLCEIVEAGPGAETVVRLPDAH